MDRETFCKEISKIRKEIVDSSLKNGKHKNKYVFVVHVSRSDDFSVFSNLDMADNFVSRVGGRVDVKEVIGAE